MRKDTLYYINTDNGCGIRAAQNIVQAKRQTLREAGTDKFKNICKATQEDIDWVSIMGGHIPQGVIAKQGKGT